MSEATAEQDLIVHVFAKPSEPELLAAIRAYLDEQDPPDEWTSSRVHIVGEAYAQLNTDGKSENAVIASLMGLGLPRENAAHLVKCAADMQRELAERDGPAPLKYDPVRWPEMIFWLFVIGAVVNACNADGVRRELATVWFTGYLEPGSVPGQRHRLAVAAFVSHSASSGGEHAAPIVAAVLGSMAALNPEQKGK